MKKIILSNKNTNESLIKEYPNFLFVYGNTYRKNTINKYSNVVGISLKKGFGIDNNSWWGKYDLENFKTRIDNEFLVIENHLDKGAIVVLPLEKMGLDNTSKLLEKNPDMYAYLQWKVKQICDKYGIYESTIF